MFFVFDIETMGVESTSIILSLALTRVEPETLSNDPNISYRQLLDSTYFAKLDYKEQIALNRTWDAGTRSWWMKQTKPQQKASLIPSSSDVQIAHMYNDMKAFVQGTPNYKNLPVWIRGTLDQLAFESILRAVDLEPILMYNQYRDVRTAIDLLFPTSQGGYVNIPEFELGNVIKHDPRHDCAYDALQLLRGEQI